MTFNWLRKQISLRKLSGASAGRVTLPGSSPLVAPRQDDWQLRSAGGTVHVDILTPLPSGVVGFHWHAGISSSNPSDADDYATGTTANTAQSNAVDQFYAINWIAAGNVNLTTIGDVKEWTV